MAKDFIGEQGVVQTAARTFDFTDESGLGADDGTPIKSEMVMQLHAVTQKLMADAGFNFNNLPENAVSQQAGDQQIFQALVSKIDTLVQNASDIFATQNTIPKRSPAEGELRALIDGAGADLYLSGGSADSKTILPNLGYLLRAIPIGTILPFGSATVPSGWFECSGANVQRASYPLLFAAIGTTWGVGDGSTTFTLPDLRNRFISGAWPASSAAGESLASPAASSAINGTNVGDYNALSGFRYSAHVKFIIRGL